MRKIRLLGDPVLRRRSKEVEALNKNVESIVEELFQIMYSEDGVGLAAPQIGVSLRIFVIDDGKPMAFINPKILWRSEDTNMSEEGCLSIPDVFEDVERSNSVVVEYLDFKGNVAKKQFLGYTARVIQHEYDHLDGVLFIDRIAPNRRIAIREKLISIIREANRK